MRRFSTNTIKMSQRIQFKVTGKVQGVCFRAFTADKAESLKLTGHVQNEKDGSVTGEAQGEQSALSQFVQLLNKGPPAARVSTVDHSDIATKEGEKGFNE
ncbi:hypothetical protein Q7P36_003675 [Cladosporium allicinum]